MSRLSKSRHRLLFYPIRKGMRTELGPVTKGRRTYLPPAVYTLSRKEKKTLCKFLSEVKVPEGYSSDIRRLVSMKDLKLKRYIKGKGILQEEESVASLKEVHLKC